MPVGQGGFYKGHQTVAKLQEQIQAEQVNVEYEDRVE